MYPIQMKLKKNDKVVSVLGVDKLVVFTVPFLRVFFIGEETTEIFGEVVSTSISYFISFLSTLQHVKRFEKNEVISVVILLLRLFLLY